MSAPVDVLATVEAILDEHPSSFRDWRPEDLGANTWVLETLAAEHEAHGRALRDFRTRLEAKGWPGVRLDADEAEEYVALRKRARRLNELSARARTAGR
jgi:hypothetical protein